PRSTLFPYTTLFRSPGARFCVDSRRDHSVQRIGSPARDLAAVTRGGDHGRSTVYRVLQPTVRGSAGDYLGWLRIMPDTDPMRDTALLYVLRNHLGLTGTRFGCGLGLCGACLVLIDGRPAYSCDTPVWAVENRDVTTVEGLGASGRPHPAAQAIIDGQAAQCGYCISGVVISAAGLLAVNDDPSEDEVRAALDRNLCRCGAHNRIVRAVLAAASSLRASRDSG